MAPPEAEDVPEGISLERYAEISAHLRRTPRNRVADKLRELGVTREQWERGRIAWTRALEAEVAQEGGDLLLRWSAAHAAARKGIEERTGPQAPAEEPPAVVSSPAMVAAPAMVTAPAMVNAPAPTNAAADRTSDALPIIRDPLPFKRATPGAPAAPPRREPKPPKAPKRREAAGPGAGGAALGDVTAQLPTLQDLKDPLPFKGPSRPGSAASDLTLEQYASLQAELRASPERAAETRAKYRVAGDEAMRALEASWRERFAREPGLRERFLSLSRRYREWLERP